MCPPRHPSPPPAPAAVPRPRASDPKREWMPFRCRSVQTHACHIKSISAVGLQPLKSSSSCSRSPPPGLRRHPPIPDGICTAGVLLVMSTNSAPAEGARRSGRVQGGVGSRRSSRILHAMSTSTYLQQTFKIASCDFVSMECKRLSKFTIIQDSLTKLPSPSNRLQASRRA